jgi:ABC-type glycerol-3-phosphate transport system substrate-binding protein
MIHDRSPRLAKLMARLAGVVLVGLLAAACGSGGGSASPPAGVPSSGNETTTTTQPVTSTTSGTLAPCGATRDPLDPTDAGPPAGSPAVC